MTDGRHVVSCHVMSCHVMSCHLVSCRVASRRVMSRRVISRRVVSRHVVSCHVLSSRVASCRVVSCYAREESGRQRTQCPDARSSPSHHACHSPRVSSCQDYLTVCVRATWPSSCTPLSPLSPAHVFQLNFRCGLTDTSPHTSHISH